MNNKKKLLVILGPTASGKSDLAVEIAQKFNGEVISADSRQVYKGLDVGTGKITVAEMNGIHHHLLDVADPKDTFTVQDFQNQATSAIKNIHLRNKLPIICGGTGFYIDAVTEGIVLPDVKKNESLRTQLSLKQTEELFSLLQKADKERAATIDPHNRVRLIRALEIVESMGSVPLLQKKTTAYDILKIGIKTPLDELKKKIQNRLYQRMEAGMVEEAVKLHEQGLSYERMYSLGLEYRYLSMYLQHTISHEWMIERLNIESFQYAKRQLQWWKKDAEINWITVTSFLSKFD